MSRLTVEVGRARIDDLDDILALWTEGREEALRSGRSSLTAEQLRPRLAEAIGSGHAEVVLARREGVPAGFVILREPPMSFLAESSSLCIEQLFVSPAHRRHGVARAMLGYVSGRAERTACDQILTSVTPWARETHRFFARLGFLPVSVHRSVAPAVLRRRLAGATSRASSRGAIEDLLSRRRSLRARTKRLQALPVVDGPITGEQPRLA